MSGLEVFIKRWWYRKFHPVFRLGVGNARAAAQGYDVPRFALGLAMMAYGYRKQRSAPRLIYSTSIDTDESVTIRVLRGRKPLGEARIDR
jgi:hypothetical protein